MIFRSFPIRRFAIVTAAVVLAGCQTVDPATRMPKTSETVQQGARGAMGGALICGLGTFARGGGGREAGRAAARCAVIAGAAGAIAGAAEDERDRQLLAEFQRAGLIVRIRGANLVLESADAIRFAQGSADLSGGSRLLVSVAKILKRFPHRAIDVKGHASADEPASLAEDRANVTAIALVNLGVGRGRVRAFGVGAREPIFPWGGPGSSRNRRVEIFFVPMS